MQYKYITGYIVYQKKVAISLDTLDFKQI